MRNAAIAILGLLFATGCAAESGARKKVQSSHIDICPSKKPRDIDRLIETPALNLFVHPATLPGNFNGCRYVWFENGDLFMITKFIAGRPTHSELYEPDAEKLICEYDKNSDVILGPVDTCKKILTVPNG